MVVNDTKVFKNKSVSDLYKEVYDRSKKWDLQLTNLVLDLQKMIVGRGDALVLVPVIASYVKMAIDNDGNLIKMLAIVTKAADRGNTDEGYDINDKEREELLQIAQEMVAEKTIKKGKATNSA